MRDNKYIIRDLTRKDRVTLTGLLKKMIETVGEKSLSQIIVADEDSTSKETEGTEDSKLISLAIEIFKQLIIVLDDDVAVWFADLLNMELEKYTEDTPFDIETIVIKQIIESESFISFFSQASELYKKITVYRNK